MFNASFVKGDLATSWCGHPKARHADMAQMLFRCLDIKISIQSFLRRFTTSHWCHLCCLLDEYWYSYSSHLLHIISEPCWISESLMTIHQQAQLQAALHSGWWWCSQRSLTTGVCLEILAWWTMIGGAVGWGKVCLQLPFPKWWQKWQEGRNEWKWEQKQFHRYGNFNLVCNLSRWKPSCWLAQVLKSIDHECSLAGVPRAKSMQKTQLSHLDLLWAGEAHNGS